MLRGARPSGMQVRPPLMPEPKSGRSGPAMAHDAGGGMPFPPQARVKIEMEAVPRRGGDRDFQIKNEMTQAIHCTASTSAAAAAVAAATGVGVGEGAAGGLRTTTAAPPPRPALGLGGMSGELSLDRADVMTLTTPFAAGAHTRPLLTST